MTAAPERLGDRDGLRPGVVARHDGAKALLITVLGEFVQPGGGAVWTATLIAAADVLGISEKNARQAIARIGDQGLIEPVRHGRRVRWSLTARGSVLLSEGARRIYSFGATPVAWSGTWLMAYCPVADTGRHERNRLRSRLRFLGFGELAPRLLISPHLEREAELRRVLHDLGLADDSIVFHSTSAGDGDDAQWVSRAWDLDGLEAAYEEFVHVHATVRPDDDAGAFRAIVELVHHWRCFPFADPELPSQLLPEGWTGARAACEFGERRVDLSPAARRWFRELEARARAAS